MGGENQGKGMHREEEGKEKVGIAYAALSVWVQQSGCQKEETNRI